ncbi:type I-B CRISPR-associated protein Cas7/Csh2 [Methanotrichaceae archaeon M04Ac]|uniref:Type I-B CRISPR-associated protein Cas7/Csh2 n=1 Tax=Candidatus Methanocrinis alkalitolerans TaxID=3033395 RepID=A0ABT5XCQ2_9EURY|nr:type I-B CRISPR-associated protein Cas7/Csh2 [Candidatus Methanocrinis alkalitolerans]MDF0592489.1 type I-B CRISPR-associated protein Cas7/Csh2 [Candidatus Methanocrinis alkalitolerans]
MSEEVKNRSEILFIYDIRDGNPNGDPLDENKPRIDEEAGVNIVTDVRLKRTIRDYLHDFKSLEIFVREIVYDEQNMFIQDGKRRAKDFGENAEKILDDCIDVRLFGGVIPLKGDSITYTGPVQFKMGRSLHRVTMKHIKGTGAFASKEGSKQATFREEDILPYSLILFYGIINENAAKHTGLSEEDVTFLLDGIWNGTKSLISRTKTGQVPRLLMKVNYSKKNYHIGDLDKMIKLVTDMPHESIRDTADFQLEISELVNKLAVEKGSIKDIEICSDDRVNFCKDGADFSIDNLAEATGIVVKQITF